MTKKEVEKDLKEFAGGSFVTTNQVQKYLKSGKALALSYVRGLQTLEQGRQRTYFVPDVADRIARGDIR